MQNSKGKKFKASLSHPVGVNSTYRIGFDKKKRKNVIIKSTKANTWEEAALAELRRSGFTPQTPQMYWCSARIDLYTSRLDIDATIKAILDLVMKALSIERKILPKVKGGRSRTVYEGVEDKWNGQLIVHKHFVSPKAQQRVELEIEIIPIKTKKQFNEITASRRI